MQQNIIYLYCRYMYVIILVRLNYKQKKVSIQYVCKGPNVLLHYNNYANEFVLDIYI